MRIAVAGATGNIGGLTVSALEDAGHDVARISRSLGVDLTTGVGLDRALTGVDAVIDTTNSTVADAEASIRHFAAMTGNLLAAEQRAGVRHHVLLSIAGVDRVAGNAHYAGKREQERLVTGGRVPWTIVPATQFHDFAEMVAGWSETNGVAARPAPARPARRPVGRCGRVGRGRGRATTPALRRRGRPGTTGPGGHGAAHVRSTRPRGDAAADVVRGVRSSDGR